MSETIKNLYPQRLWTHFYDLCQVPRPSKKEQEAVAFFSNFGHSLGLETIVDQVGNVIIRKPATKGKENCQTVTLQGHLDMVPQANQGVDHNFETDPIRPYIDGEWLTAQDTTLGADNGMAVAAAMAILEATDLEHGPIETFMTVDEEAGMTGAFSLKPNVLKGDILLNLDTEDEGELYIGCAGGIDTVVEVPLRLKAAPNAYLAYEIELKGLNGGHSGMDIALGRGNAIKLMARLLWESNQRFGILLSRFEGGTVRNAIPREAFATVFVSPDRQVAFETLIADMAKVFKQELQYTEKKLQLSCQKTTAPGYVFEENLQIKLLNSLYACVNGVVRMSDQVHGLVETSSNLGVLQQKDELLKIITLQRSSVDTAKNDLSQQIRANFEPLTAIVRQEGGYPGWKPNANSPILQLMKKIYEEMYGRVPAIKAVHAGLETGVIGSLYPDMDMISIGPTIKYPHSPDERVHIESVGKFWDFLVETLKQIQ